MRWLARSMDYILFELALMPFLLPHIIVENTMESIRRDQQLTALVVLLFLLVEPVMLSLWGTTPGKMLLGMRVTKPDRSRLGFGEALRRSVNVWFRGMGMYLGIVTVFTMVHAFNKLTRDGITTWDKHTGSLVLHTDPGATRTTIAVLVIVGLKILGLVTMIQALPK